jgi:tetratricopeptide (TPR) repeat protein
VIWLYLRLFVLPVEQNADYIIAVSRTLADPAPWIGLGALLLAILVAAKYRYRYRLAWFGVLLFLLLLSPTSSFLPIKDAAVERRMYLPSFALLLICIDLLRDVRIKPLLAGSACVFVALFAATRARAHLWSSGAILWEDVLAKSPHNLRGYTHLVYGYLRERRCADAARRLDHLPPSIQPDVPLLVSWSHVYTCLSRYDDAIAKLEEATAQKPSADVYTLIAVAQRRLGNDPAARAAIEEALVLDPNFEAAQAVRQELAGDSSKPEN